MSRCQHYNTDGTFDSIECIHCGDIFLGVGGFERFRNHHIDRHEFLPDFCGRSKAYVCDCAIITCMSAGCNFIYSKCPHCGIHFLTRELRDIHLNIDHDSILLPYRCRFCNIDFINELELTLHREVELNCVVNILTNINVPQIHIC